MAKEKFKNKPQVKNQVKQIQQPKEPVEASKYANLLDWRLYLYSVSLFIPIPLIARSILTILPTLSVIQKSEIYGM